MPEAAPAETGATMIDPKWARHSDAAGRTYWFNASTATSQWERPPFLFRAATTFPPGSTISVSNPYDGTALMVAFPQGADPTQWHAIPAPAQQQAQQQAQAQQQLHAQQQALRQQAIARQQAEAARQAEELEYQADDPDSDLANAAEVEIYETYRPQKLKIGTPHPDPVVEASCLSTVPSPDITYLSKLRIHKEKHQAATALSALQLEAVLYACQRHETKEDGKRGGFFIGDGAGMGKGREIAGCLIENLLQGREKALWVSISADLKVDAERDLSGTKFWLKFGKFGQYLAAFRPCLRDLWTDCGCGDFEVVALNKWFVLKQTLLDRKKSNFHTKKYFPAKQPLRQAAAG